MNLFSSRALSDEIPAVRPMCWRARPPAASSILPTSSTLRLTWRLTSFSSSTCRSALSRSSLADSMTMAASPDNSTRLLVSLKS